MISLGTIRYLDNLSYVWLLLGSLSCLVHRAYPLRLSLTPPRRTIPINHRNVLRLQETLAPDKAVDRSIYQEASGAWVPMGSISSFDTKYPIALEVLGEKYVIWKAPGGNMSEGWGVMRDICPHRLAPLSEGRVDAVSGCLECPYHGWQFNTQGACTKIPQLDPGKTLPTGGTSASSFKIKVVGDVLFSYLPIPGQVANHFPAEPESLFPILSDIKSFVVRELPYSVDFLVENFMDPAHIPFAHHSLQTTRDEGCPIPMELLTSLDNPSAIEITFEDIMFKKVRQGIVSFKPPFYYHFRYRPKDPNAKRPSYGKLLHSAYNRNILLSFTSFAVT
jgi:phenylpropionate dioxygenase-like ring-hydroxylating dioxygenase large terminal subunit